MNPADFLEVADRFRSSPAESERRTSIGRSYYALFNVVGSFLKSQGVPFEGSGRDHWRLVQYLIRSGHRRAIEIGSALRDLRIYRTKADYDMGSYLGIDHSRLAYERAQRAMIVFQALSEADLRGIVHRIRQYPPV